MIGLIRVFVVDDHPLVRRGLAAFFAVQADMELVGETSDGPSGIAQLAHLVDAGSPPDVVLLDVAMPGGGVPTGRIIAERWPGIRFVYLSGFDDPELIRSALSVGGTGFVLKDAGPEEVERAIRSATRGEVYLSPEVARELDSYPVTRGSLSSLTPREMQVLELLAEGLSNQQIAQRMVISERTARTHVSAVLVKLDVSSRTQAALLATRLGVLDARRR